jgi:hypothetical protein
LSGLCLSGGDFSSLSGHFCGDGFFHFCFSSETLFHDFAFGFSLGIFNVFQFGVFLLLPSVESALSLSLTESALGHTAFEVFHHVNTFTFENRTGRIRRSGAHFQPIQSSVEIDVESCRIGQRVVGAQIFDKTSVTWCSTIRNYKVVKRLVLFTASL